MRTKDEEEDGEEEGVSGVLVLARECIYINVQLYILVVMTIMNKCRRRSTA
jgi:hypothetical protein